MLDIATVRGRFLVFWLLLALPLVRLFLREQYGFFHAEVGLLVGAASGLAAVLAVVVRNRLLFHASVVAAAVLLSVASVQADLLPQVRGRWIILGLLAALMAGIYLLRQNFYKLLAVFLLGGLLTDAVKTASAGSGFRAQAELSSGAARNHVVHIIFDEMQGLGSMPPECVSCRLAREELEATFRSGNFTAFPYAFSNYSRTRDSIPSILNADLALEGTGQYFKGSDPRPYLRKNAYFEGYLARKYAIRTYQSDWILYSAPEYPSVLGTTYNANTLKALHETHFPWTVRLGRIPNFFVRSDRFLWSIWERVAPERWRQEAACLCAISTGDLWPQRILADIRSATGDTLFFAHLMTPHWPYIYKGDGSVRTPEEWPTERSRLLDTEEAEHRRKYEQYGEQVRFVNRQFRAFLDGLRAAGQYHSALVIVHGDHGSRLRLATPEQRAAFRERGAGPPSSRYDYVSQPGVQDLLNRFGTLLAIKLPGAAAPQTTQEKGSVLYFFRRVLGAAGNLGEPGLNSVFLFDENGRPREIPLRDMWREAGGDAQTGG